MATESLRTRTVSRPLADEHRFRLAVGGALLLCALAARTGLIWDIQWHLSVGRDRFLSPPHVLLYAGVLLGGVVCAGAVAVETFRRWGGALTLGVVRAPLGLLVTGAGLATMVAAAPLDNYWHTLYGIDVALWTPFHMMGLIGGGVAALGSLYLWSALHARRPTAIEAWGVRVAAALLVMLMMTIAQPGLLRSSVVQVGVPVAVYPVLLALLLPWVLRAASDAAPGRSATAVALIVLAVDAATQAGMAWAIEAGAAWDGLPIRIAPPPYNPVPLLLGLAPLLAALVIDLLPRRATWANAALVGAAAAVPLALFGGRAATIAARLAGASALVTTFRVGTLPGREAVIAAIPLALAAGALSGLIGAGLGVVLRRSRR